MMNDAIHPMSTNLPLPLLELGDDERWRLLVARSPAAEGRFVVAVKTTGIYCRPTCTARLPKRENVTFYASGEEALAAGFRPCRRCTPDADSPSERQRALIAESCRLIAASEEPLRLKDLAAAVGFSPFHLQRLFTRIVGVSPRQYAAGLRRKRLQEELSRGRSVTEAIYEAGFGSASRMYEASAALLGMAPTTYRRRGEGLTLRLATAPCSLGWVGIAASAQGVAAIALGTRAEEIEVELRGRFRAARFDGGDGELALWLREVVAAIDEARPPRDLPLDIHGTAFEEQVWQALRAIPRGTTRSYREVAAAIGRPTAARAVARACAANPLAVVVPCHRVVTSGGGLGGYRWGTERKERLLERERQG